jgi:hypothetical protein
MGIIVNFTKKTVHGFGDPNVWVEATSADSKTGKTVTSNSYALKCRPTQRMF